MMDRDLKLILEALLLCSQEPITLEKMMATFDEWEMPSTEVVKDALNELKHEYENTRAFGLVELASGYVLQTKKQYSQWVTQLQLDKPSKYSRALLETLAIIAYRQPVTRGDIEDIRGVAVNSHIMKTLLDREWIRVAGYRDVPGKPAVFTTTKEFLNYFNLKHLSELPALPEVAASLIPDFENQPEEECVVE